MSPPLKLTTLNVRGLGNAIKRKRLLSLATRLNMDILLLQETHLKKTNFPIINKHHYPYQIHAPGNGKARGTAILISKNHCFQELTSLKDREGRYVITKGFLNAELVTIASIYAPNDGQICFLEDVLLQIQHFSDGLLLIAGDFNYVADLHLDRTYKKGLGRILAPHTYTALHDLFEKHNLIDCWRQANPTTKDYTFFSARHDIFSRIDYCLMSKHDAYKLQNSEIGCQLLSDHSWVTCDFTTPNSEPREYNWTLNRSLLQSKLFTQGTRAAIKTYLELNGTTDCKDSTKWDALKVTIRGTIISTSAHLKKLREHQLQDILSSIDALEAQFKQTGRAEVYANLLQKRKSLEVLETDAIKKNLIY